MEWSLMFEGIYLESGTCLIVLSTGWARERWMWLLISLLLFSVEGWIFWIMCVGYWVFEELFGYYEKNDILNIFSQNKSHSHTCYTHLIHLIIHLNQPKLNQLIRKSINQLINQIINQLINQ
jgi:hypothetical protein